MKVKATSTGLYDNMLRKPGHPLGVFDIKSESEFAWEWMEPIGWTPKSQRPGFFMETNTEGEEVKSRQSRSPTKGLTRCYGLKLPPKNSEARAGLFGRLTPSGSGAMVCPPAPVAVVTPTPRSRTGSSGPAPL